MAVFQQREVNATTRQTTRVCVPKRGKIEGYEVVRLLDINGKVIGKAFMTCTDKEPFYRQYN